MYPTKFLVDRSFEIFKIMLSVVGIKIGHFWNPAINKKMAMWKKYLFEVLPSASLQE